MNWQKALLAGLAAGVALNITDFLLHGPHGMDLAGVIAQPLQGAQLSPAADAIVEALGDDQAKAIVVWWSLRESIKPAQGLRMPRKHKQSNLLDS